MRPAAVSSFDSNGGRPLQIWVAIRVSGATPGPPKEEGSNVRQEGAGPHSGGYGLPSRCSRSRTISSEVRGPFCAPLIAQGPNGPHLFELLALATSASVAASFDAAAARSLIERCWAARGGGRSIAERWVGVSDPGSRLLARLDVERLDHAGDYVARVLDWCQPRWVRLTRDDPGLRARARRANCQILVDVRTVDDVDRCADLDIDGLVLSTSGFGCHTLDERLFFAAAIRDRWQGPLVLEGGVANGRGLLAAVVAGIDLVEVDVLSLANSLAVADPSADLTATQSGGSGSVVEEPPYGFRIREALIDLEVQYRAAKSHVAACLAREGV